MKQATDKRGPAFHAEVQSAVCGYQISMMDIPKVYRHAEACFDAGKNVTEAVRAYLDIIAVKV